MIRLILDEHLAPAVATGLRQFGIDTITPRDWSGPTGLGASDGDLLTAALADLRVLVSYDRATIEPLLRTWAESGLHHAGVILVDDRTIRASDRGGLIRSLAALVDREGEEDWIDRVVYLRRV